MISKPSRPRRAGAFAASVVAVSVLLVTGCGSSSSSASGGAPSASDFPAVAGKSYDELLTSVDQNHSIAVSPTGVVFKQGQNRFGFGIFNVDQSPVTGADVAVYAAPATGGKVEGPFTASWESLATDQKYEATSTATDPDAAQGLYVTHLNFGTKGPWNLMVIMRQDGKLSSARVNTSLIVGAKNKIPKVGQKAPAIHTLTASDVGGNLGKIDTRAPHDDMHSVDLADAIGKQPVVLLFATPALCTSRVCGPVVDIAEQVEHEPASKGVAFIHQEIYNDNNASKGLQQPVIDYGLRTEPWLFVLDRHGRISTRIEGAFDPAELQAAVKKVAGT